MSQIKTKPFDSQQYTPLPARRRTRTRGRTRGREGEEQGEGEGEEQGEGEGEGEEPPPRWRQKGKRLPYGEVRVCKLECVSLRSKLMTFDLHPPRCPATPAQLQCHGEQGSRGQDQEDAQQAHGRA